MKLDDIKTTAVTRQLITLAEESGLRPHAEPARLGRVGVIINGEGRDALFGVIYVSAKHGNVLRAHLTHGNGGQEKRYEYVAEIRAVLQSWAAFRRAEQPAPAVPAGPAWAGLRRQDFDASVPLTLFDVDGLDLGRKPKRNRCGTAAMF